MAVTVINSRTFGAIFIGDAKANQGRGNALRRRAQC
jgi:hypothetical protein